MQKQCLGPPLGSVGTLVDTPTIPAPAACPAALSGFSPSPAQILDLSQVTYPWPGDIFADTAGYLYGRLRCLLCLLGLLCLPGGLPACLLPAALRRTCSDCQPGSIKVHASIIPPRRRHPDLP